jgi:hypothetical protein
MKNKITNIVGALIILTLIQTGCSSSSGILDKDQTILLRQVEMYTKLLCRENLTVNRLLESVGSLDERIESTVKFTPFEGAFSQGLIRLDSSDDQPLIMQIHLADPTEYGFKVFAEFFGRSDGKIKSGFDGKFYVPLKNYTFHTCNLEVEITLTTEAKPSPESPDPNVLMLKMKRLR